MLSCKEHRLFLPSYDAPQDLMKSSPSFLLHVYFLSHATIVNGCYCVTEISGDSVRYQPLQAPMEAPPYDRSRAIALAGLDYAHILP